MFYKSTNNLVDIPLEKYVTPAPTGTRANHSKKIRQLSATTNTFKYSFIVRTISVWNSLPAPAAEAPSLVQFRRELSKLKF